jgi:hypothetical protein
MTAERTPQELLRALADESIPPEDPATLDRRRQRVVAATAMAIARAARERDQRRRWARLGVPAAAAAAAAAIVAGGLVWRSRVARDVAATDAPVAVGEPLVGSLHRSHGGAPLAAATSNLPLGAGEDVATEPGGRGEIVLADGVDITLESETRLRLPDASVEAAAKAHEAIGLASGMVAVRVPPMAVGHTFSVKTPDAEVTVHGTSFTVEVLPPRPSGGVGPATRVRVTTGVVSVSAAGRETELTAGMEWVSPVESKTGVPAAPPAASAAPTAPAVTTTTAAPAATHTASGPVSRLGEENRLLAAAIAASKAGDHAGAVSSLDELLRRYPASALAQEAHVERFRALARGGDAAGAAREARLYLALYPDGFAREEARGLAVGP